ADASGPRILRAGANAACARSARGGRDRDARGRRGGPRGSMDERPHARARRLPRDRMDHRDLDRGACGRRRDHAALRARAQLHEPSHVDVRRRSAQRRRLPSLSRAERVHRVWRARLLSGARMSVGLHRRIHRHLHTHAQSLAVTLWKLIVPPLAWAAHFMFAYIYAAVRCAKGGRDAFVDDVRIAVAVATAVALGVVHVTAYVAWAQSRLPGDPPPHDESTHEDRHRFLAVSTLLLACLSFVAIVFTAIPAFYFEDCR